jgi:hypothetical protein
MGAAAWTGMDAQVATDAERLLRGVMDTDTVQQIGDAGCSKVVLSLTMRALNALTSSDAASQRVTQVQLATALLRWNILRAV